MVDSAVLVAAVLLWLAVLYEAASLTRQRNNRARRALLLTLVALALAATFFVPSVYVATQDLTGVSNLADLVARCAVLMASLGAQSLLLHLTQEPAAAIRMSRRRAVALASAVVLLVVLFVLAPIHETGTLRLTSDFGDSPWIIGYLVVFAGYLGIALVDVLRGGLRYAPKAGTAISLALRLIAIGCVFGLLYVAEKIGFLIAVLLAGSPSAAVESSVARMLAVLGGLFVLAGSLVPALYPVWLRTVHLVTTYRAHRELYPLSGSPSARSTRGSLSTRPRQSSGTGCASGISTFGCTGGSSRSATDAWRSGRSSMRTLPGMLVRMRSEVA
jgi:hypothetical protein